MGKISASHPGLDGYEAKQTYTAPAAHNSQKMAETTKFIEECYADGGCVFVQASRAVLCPLHALLRLRRAGDQRAECGAVAGVV